MPDDAEEETAAQKTANENLATAEAQLASFEELQALDDANPVKALVNSLLEADTSDGDDDGQALVDAISSNYQTANDAATTADEAETTANAAMDAVAGLSGEDGDVAGNTAAIAALTAEDDPDTDADETGPITENADGIVDLDGTGLRQREHPCRPRHEAHGQEGIHRCHWGRDGLRRGDGRWNR